MNIAIVGTGYVGLVSGTCFAEMGIDVTCVDVNEEKIKSLKVGQIPIYEPGLEDMVKRNVAVGRLHFSTNLAECINDVEIVFSAVGTPPDEDGSADLSYVLAVARTFGRYINKYTILVTKSTVPVGTAEKVKVAIQEELDKRKMRICFDVASNPEFLKEGAAVADFMSPDRVVIGVESENAQNLMSKLYRPFMLNNFRVLFTDIPSAEMIKYAANSMLATRISFMNDIANLCERVGADINMVRKGIGSDTRIGRKFLYPGCGYGGSCFPKDVKALVRAAENNGYEMKVLKAVEAVNEKQKEVVVDKLLHYYGGDLKGRVVTIWGLAFKPETNDMREATSLVVIRKLLEAGCSINAFDPIAVEESERRLGDGTLISLGCAKITYANDMYEALRGSDALLLLTEWKQFRVPDWSIVKELLSRPLVIDGRNIYDSTEMIEHGFEYGCIGR